MQDAKERGPLTERAIGDHPMHGQAVPGYLATVGELGRVLIDSAVDLLHQTRRHRDAPYDALVRHAGIDDFLTRLGSRSSRRNTVPVVGTSRSCEIRNGRVIMPGRPPLRISCAVRGVHLADEMRRDDFSVPYVTHGVLRLLEGTNADIPAPVVEIDDTPPGRPQMAVTYLAGDEDGAPVRFYLSAWPHGAIGDLDQVIDQVATQMYLRHRHADDLKRIRGAILTHVREEAGPLVRVRGMCLSGTWARGLANQQPRMGRMTYDVEVEALNDHLLPEASVHEIEAFSQDEIEIPRSLRDLAVRSRQRERRKGRPTIDLVAALKLAERPDELLAVADHMEAGRLDTISHGSALYLRDGRVHRRVLLSEEPRVVYRDQAVVLEGVTLPMSIRHALKGRPARALVDHALLEGSTIRSVAETEDGISARLDVPEIDAAALRALIS